MAGYVHRALWSGVPLVTATHAAQVRQLFELGDSASDLLQPASPQEILAALLGVLRDAHWCQAVHCKAEPALMTPISLATACSGAVRNLGLSYDLQRAIAAAERQAVLLPDSGYAV